MRYDVGGFDASVMGSPNHPKTIASFGALDLSYATLCNRINVSGNYGSVKSQRKSKTSIPEYVLIYIYIYIGNLMPKVHNREPEFLVISYFIKI